MRARKPQINEPVPASDEHDARSSEDEMDIKGSSGAGAAPRPGLSRFMPQNVASTIAKPAQGTTAAASLDWLERNEGFVAVLTLVVGFITRFYRLDQPAGLVFDEVHFG